MAKRRDGGVSWLFATVVAVLVVALIILALNTMSARERYDYLASLTPTPTTVPKRVSYAMDNATPAPTSLQMSNGSTGENVLLAQQRLQALGFYDGPLDGQFGQGTRTAVMWFQRQHGLTDDGIVGPNTWAVLMSTEARQAVSTPAPSYAPIETSSLPALVNAAHPLSADWVPGDLVSLKEICPDGLYTIKAGDALADREAANALIKMLRAAASDGITVWQITDGYRSFEEQRRVFEAKVQSFLDQGRSRESAESSARVTVADPGTSEHQTGLAFDITVPNTTMFSGTEQCRWLHAHCHEYGFILRYTDEKAAITGHTGEAWHFRYVGVGHSAAMRASGECLEEYIARAQRQ